MANQVKQEWAQLLGSSDAADELWDALGAADELRSRERRAPREAELSAAWLEVRRQLGADPAVDAAQRRPRAVREVSSKRRATLGWRRLSFIAAVSVLVLFVVNYFSADPGFRQISNDGTSPLLVELSDNSSVRLDPGATLTYVEADQSRRASLAGTAFFSVSRDTDRPFSVSTDDFEVLVVGTAFEVVAEAVDQVRVQEGHVRVRGQYEADWTDLYAGDVVRIADRRVAIASPDLSLNFEDASLQQVAEALEAAFSRTLSYPDHLANCLVTANWSRATFLEVAEQIGELFGAEVTSDAKGSTLRGGSCR